MKLPVKVVALFLVSVQLFGIVVVSTEGAVMESVMLQPTASVMVTERVSLIRIGAFGRRPIAPYSLASVQHILP